MDKFKNLTVNELINELEDLKDDDETVNIFTSKFTSLYQPGKNLILLWIILVTTPLSNKFSLITVQLICFLCHDDVGEQLIELRDHLINFHGLAITQGIAGRFKCAKNGCDSRFFNFFFYASILKERIFIIKIIMKNSKLMIVM